ncbi:MAG: BolA/IbaG family iron-sulfur metabolism protein [Pseudomonadota bacterium]
MTPADIEALIQSALAPDVLDVRSDDDVHFDALVVCAEFVGKRPVARHQMIYAALGDHMRADIHALSITALTPDEHAGKAT